MSTKVSVHIIAKEVTEYGRLMFQESLLSLIRRNSGYADEIVLYDDGCSDKVIDLIVSARNEFIVTTGNKFKVRVGDDIPKTFAEKRNQCLGMTAPDVTHIHWIDTDDIYYTDKLMPFKEQLSNLDVEVWYSHFIHCMVYPWRYEGVHQKNNVFKFNKDLEWKNEVHETLCGVDNEKSMISALIYYHAGYTRSVVATAIKWIYYSVLEHGKDNCCYYRDSEPMYVDGFDAILRDRMTNTLPLDFIKTPFSESNLTMVDFNTKIELAIDYNKMPVGELQNYMTDSRLLESTDWDRYVTYQLDPIYGEFLDRHKVIAKQEGHWGKAIDEVIEKELWRVM